VECRRRRGRSFGVWTRTTVYADRTIALTPLTRRQRSGRVREEINASLNARERARKRRRCDVNWCTHPVGCTPRTVVGPCHTVTHRLRVLCVCVAARCTLKQTRVHGVVIPRSGQRAASRSIGLRRSDTAGGVAHSLPIARQSRRLCGARGRAMAR